MQLHSRDPTSIAQDRTLNAKLVMLVIVIVMMMMVMMMMAMTMMVMMMMVKMTMVMMTMVMITMVTPKARLLICTKCAQLAKPDFSFPFCPICKNALLVFL
jgi:hypothetical protein